MSIKIPLEVALMAQCREISQVVSLLEVYYNPTEFAWYLVMQRQAHCVDLFEHIGESEKLEEWEARFLFRQLAAVVSDCHQQHVIHRDLKDDNVLLDRSRTRILLIDFGGGAFIQPEPFKDYTG